MGAGQSSVGEIAGSTMGYQVLRVYPNSPGSRAGLKAYFDFIIAIGNTRFNKENNSLREILKASVDQKLKMVVFNTRSKTTREVEIVPSLSWGGNGLLGVSIKHSSFDRADERVWHVVDVEPGSPAQQAGFRANEDYVIGSDSILQENEDLFSLIEKHEGKALKLFVYNVNNDNCREIICHPNSRWGGKGYLGCEFGHGLLHRIPFGDIGNAGSDESARASLLRNEQPVATLESNNQTNKSAPTFQSQLMSTQNQQPVTHSPAMSANQQPGQQLLQQALFNSSNIQQLSAKQPQQQVPLQAPQTFAQLASSQFQAQQQPNQHQNQYQYQGLHSPPSQLPQQQYQQSAYPKNQEMMPPQNQEVIQPVPQTDNSSQQNSPSIAQQTTLPSMNQNPFKTDLGPAQQTWSQSANQMPQTTFNQLATAQYQAQQQYYPPPPPVQQLQQQQQSQSHQQPLTAQQFQTTTVNQNNPILQHFPQESPITSQNNFMGQY